VKFKANLRVAAQVLLVAFQLHSVAKAAPPDSAPLQRFVCNTGYTLRECGTAVAALRKALAKYPVESLGEWTWVLVRSADWRRILLDRGFRPDSPAFSYLPRRETFLDGSLVAEVSTRSIELREKWHMSIQDLLDLAIRHEIAHGLCNDRNETKAGVAAKALKERKALSCQATLIAKNSTNETRNTE
jgi:hypothetical protein